MSTWDFMGLQPTWQWLIHIKNRIVDWLMYGWTPKDGRYSL